MYKIYTGAGNNIKTELVLLVQHLWEQCSPVYSAQAQCATPDARLLPSKVTLQTRTYQSFRDRWVTWCQSGPGSGTLSPLPPGGLCSSSGSSVRMRIYPILSPRSSERSLGAPSTPYTRPCAPITPCDTESGFGGRSLYRFAGSWWHDWDQGAGTTGQQVAGWGGCGSLRLLGTNLVLHFSLFTVINLSSLW